MNKLQAHRKGIIGQMVNLETMEVKKDVVGGLVQHFRKIFPLVMEQHQKILDRVFEMIINNAYPVARFSYWKDLNGPYERDFDIIKKYQKLTKYQKEQSIKERSLNEIDKLMISFNPNKYQYKFIKM
mmetsp:Transcript_12535/g.11081  ORF Transcript_12535/g.11081 Transcript_12535/m.11081 type:complete len:127 (-) Transcript_12535:365-745(-)